MSEWVSLALIFLGAFLVFVSGVGMVRMPDLFLRMAALTQSATLGAGAIFLAVAFFFADWGVSGRAIVVVIFLFLTTPVSAHAMGRAGYRSGVPLWRGTVQDDLKRDQPQLQASPDAEGLEESNPGVKIVS
ncbi:MAG: monovalent cation/H(+) antiporter subunit G [Caldilineaceae bacterium]|nr:monovalent cation/H(+) antiporter subunit G [Caldilineaceae bacterium]